jgi:SAM-dependent methyltransferase
MKGWCKMGVDYQVLRFLFSAKRVGVSFEHPVMFGRQAFVLPLTVKDAAYLANKFGWEIPKKILEQWFDEGYIEPLLEMLGAKDTTSIDASAYEGATIVHDMNRPLPREMKNRFSVAIDFGTLEHVFNYPQALKNAMESVAPGGHFLTVTPCNGWPGHGFYQFSPELFFRALSPENGFELEYQYICQTGNGDAWYRCIDPKLLNRRATIPPTACLIYLLVQAKRTVICDVFSNPPQQSDYVSVWTGQGVSPPPQPQWRRLVPRSIKRLARSLITPRLKIRDLAAFQPVDE